MPSFLANPANFFWLAIAVIVCLPVVAEYWRKMRKDELDANLKQDMLARGMSADEIERVLSARGEKIDR
jgi:hypothetical protein